MNIKTAMMEWEYLQAASLVIGTFYRSNIGMYIVIRNANAP